MYWYCVAFIYYLTLQIWWFLSPCVSVSTLNSTHLENMFSHNICFIRSSIVFLQRLKGQCFFFLFFFLFFVVVVFSCSTLLSIKFVMFKNLRLLTIANSFLLNIAELAIFSANKYENAKFNDFFIISSRENFMLRWVEHEKKKVYNLGAR